MGQFHHDLVHMGDLPLVHPVLHLSILDAGIFYGATRKFDDVLLEHGGLPYVLPLAVHLNFCCRTPPSCLKVRGGWHSQLYA